MKLTIGTQRLQALLNKAFKGAGCNNVIPMTSLIVISLKDGVLSLTTTDATNYLTLIEKEVSGDEFYVAVQVELLAKLISKLTCAEVTLEVTDSALEVVGNGKYKIALDLEEDGSLVRLSNPIDSFKKDNKIGSVDAEAIRVILTSIKPALATTDEYPWLINYYVSDSITSTDTYTVADYKQSFLNEPKLISSSVMDLLGLFTGNIDVYADGDKMLFETDNGLVYTTIPDGIENYIIDDVRALVNESFAYSCTVAKSALLKLLDRISLLAGEYDNGKITLSFGKDGLEVISKYANETIQYLKVEREGEFICSTDVITLLTQVKAQVGSEISLEFGNEDALKIVDGDITSVVALLEE